ncbi:MAG: hypothetical protein Q4F66_01505 [Clostridium sp.]|nr:hypothetical protein [Clostridium sp.]
MTVKDYMQLVTSGNQNTYKYALGYALAVIKPQDKVVLFEDIAEVIVEFYYIRAIVPNLRHSNNERQVPRVIQDMEEVLESYSYLPGVEKLPEELKKSMMKKVIDNITNGFFRYVLSCWEGARKNEKGYYIYPKEGKNSCFSYSLARQEIVLEEEFKECINRNSEMIQQDILEGLSEFLKKYNKK